MILDKILNHSSPTVQTHNDILESILFNKVDIFKNISMTLEFEINDFFPEMLDYTPLHMAISLKYFDILDVILSHRYVNVNQTIRDDGSTPLIFAIKCCNALAVEKLLNHSEIDVNKTIEGGKTALHYSARYGNREIFDLLVRDPRIYHFPKDDNGLTPRDWALLEQNQYAMNFLDMCHFEE